MLKELYWTAALTRARFTLISTFEHLVPECYFVPSVKAINLLAKYFQICSF